MADVEVADCVEILGRLDFSSSALSSIAMDVLDRGVVGVPRQPYSSGNQLRGNAMTMLGNLLPGLVAFAPNMVDFNFTSNFDGLAVLGQKFVEPPSNGNLSIPSSLGASLGNKSSSSGGNSSSLAAVLVSLYLVANPSIAGGQQQLVRQLSAVEVVGLGQLLCGLNATQWSTMVPAGLATGVREAVLASLTCRPTDDVSNVLYALLKLAQMLNFRLMPFSKICSSNLLIVLSNLFSQMQYKCSTLYLGLLERNC
jgi:hypothetical protein